MILDSSWSFLTQQNCNALMFTYLSDQGQLAKHVYLPVVLFYVVSPQVHQINTLPGLRLPNHAIDCLKVLGELPRHESHDNTLSTI